MIRMRGETSSSPQQCALADSLMRPIGMNVCELFPKRAHAHCGQNSWNLGADVTDLFRGEVP